MTASFNVTITPQPTGNKADAAYTANGNLPPGVTLGPNQQITVDFRQIVPPLEIEFRLQAGYSFKSHHEFLEKTRGPFPSPFTITKVTFNVNSLKSGSKRLFKHSYWVTHPDGKDLKVDPIIEIQDN